MGMGPALGKAEIKVNAGYVPASSLSYALLKSSSLTIRAVLWRQSVMQKVLCGEQPGQRTQALKPEVQIYTCNLLRLFQQERV